jgi:hypothetical protein
MKCFVADRVCSFEIVCLLVCSAEDNSLQLLRCLIPWSTSGKGYKSVLDDYRTVKPTYCCHGC